MDLPNNVIPFPGTAAHTARLKETVRAIRNQDQPIAAAAPAKKLATKPAKARKKAVAKEVSKDPLATVRGTIETFTRETFNDVTCLSGSETSLINARGSLEVLRHGDGRLDCVSFVPFDEEEEEVHISPKRVTHKGVSFEAWTKSTHWAFVIEAP